MLEGISHLCCITSLIPPVCVCERTPHRAGPFHGLTFSVMGSNKIMLKDVNVAKKNIRSKEMPELIWPVEIQPLMHYGADLIT